MGINYNSKKLSSFPAMSIFTGKYTDMHACFMIEFGCHCLSMVTKVLRDATRARGRRTDDKHD